MTYPFGVDLSKWQSKPESGLYMDMSKLLGHDDPVSFVFIRASHGMYKDPVHAFYADELDRLNIPNGSYHYASPAYSARLQVDHFLSIAPPKEGRRWVLDLEAHQGLSKARITDWTLEFIELMKERTGRYPTIYSRTSWINPYLDVGRLPKLDYWLAQYRSPVYPFTPEFPSDKIDIPKGIDRRWIKFHQTGDKADGKKYGTVSNHIDTDRFLGTHEELMAWFGREEPEEPEEPAEPPSDPVEPPAIKPLYCARVITDPGWKLNVRETAGGRVVGSLDSGDLVNVWEETSDWARIGDSRWVSMHWIARVDSGDEATDILNVTPMSQNDPRWRRHRLGTSSSTIGQMGCLVTCAAMVVKYFGYDTDPGRLNQLLIQNGGYWRGNLFVWGAISKIWPLKIGEWVDCLKVPAPLNKLDDALARKEPVIVWVDFNPKTAIEEMHWVVIVGKRGIDDYWMIDSWDGKLLGFRERYANPYRYIFRIVTYRRK